MCLFLLYNRNVQWNAPLSSQYSFTIVACGAAFFLCLGEKREMILGGFDWGCCCTRFCLRHRNNLAPHSEQQRDIDKLTVHDFTETTIKKDKPRTTTKATTTTTTTTKLDSTMGCSNSKGKKDPIGTGELTFPVVGPPPGSNGSVRPVAAATPPTPVWTTQDILRIGNTGEHHDAMVAYSLNGRNGYSVQNGMFVFAIEDLLRLKIFLSS